ncbi:MAG: SPOR domain-containing protein [Burkholderiaceae bacterium]|nr:MAG: SPOR domain-containing protein [Burkholderiaceae bacterium]
MRLLFLFIVLANAVFFAVHQGYFGSLIADGREPERMNNQLQAERLTLLSQAQFDALTQNGSPPESPALDAARTSAEAVHTSLQGKDCVEFGGFANQDLKHFEALLPTLQLGGKISQRTADEQAKWAVFIPPLKTRADVDKKVEELHHLGVTDFFIITDDPDLRNAISFGVFKTEEAAQSQLAALTKKGVHSAQVGNRNVQLHKTWYRFEKMEAGLLDKLVALRSDFPNQELTECAAKP